MMEHCEAVFAGSCALESRTPAWGQRYHREAQRQLQRARWHRPAPCQPTEVLKPLDHNAMVGEQQSMPCSAWPADVGGGGQQQRWKHGGQGAGRRRRRQG